MGLLNKLFGFRWSLYLVNSGEAVYAMHANSVIRIVGYVMRYFSNGSRPMPPWSLHLNFNKAHQSFELGPEHFSPDGEKVTSKLLDDISAIDPGYRVGGGEPVFVEVRTKKRIKIFDDYTQSILDNSNSIYANPMNIDEMLANVGKPKEPTFADIMAEIFSADKQ